MNNILEHLNPAQREAVEYNDGPHLVIAGAGSGKTRVLTYKIAYLLQNGVRAYNILALTFTNKAAREMRNRIENLVSKDEARYLWMGTFHAICARILRTESQYIGFSHDFSIYDTSDSKSLIKTILKEQQLDDKIYKANAVLSRISWAKNNMYDPVAYNRDSTIIKFDLLSRMPMTGFLYSEYQKRLLQANAMDFDDLLFNTNILFRDNPDVLQKYQQGFHYILVDEYQDTNFAQYMIVRSLAEPQQNICVVGDDAQSIYSFRGANIQNILNFRKDYSSARLFKLERNYRSTQNIVNAANSLISKNIHQIPKHVYSEKSEGDKLKIKTLDTDRDEASFLARHTAEICRKQHYGYNDIAILYRTNAQSRVIEDEMRKQAIPYRIYGGLSFYQRKEIKDATAYLNLVVNHNNEEALVRIINFPKRSIGDTTVDKIRLAARENNTAMFQVLANPQEYGVQISPATCKRVVAFYNMIDSASRQLEQMSAYQIVDLILKTSGLMAEALIDKSSDGTDRYQNLDELRNSVREFEEIRHQDGQDFVPLSDFLSEIALVTDQDKQEKTDEPRVTLMTVHSAKGLEYPVVMIAGMEDNLFPSAFAESENEIEEERRLFYVAITRAMDSCLITNARTRFRNGQINFSMPSRFLRDIDEQFIENKKDTQEQRQFVSSFIQPNFKPLNTVETGRQDIESPYPIGSRVRHSVFGEGTVIAAYNENDNDKIEIQFDKVGKKILLIRFAKLEKL